MYLLAMTRPDIALAVNQVAAFVYNPGPGHWEAVKQIFSYLAGTAIIMGFAMDFKDLEMNPHHYTASRMPTSLEISSHANQRLDFSSRSMEAQSLGVADVNGPQNYQRLMLNSMLLRKEQEKPCG
jgi:hypothetical protein